MRFDAVFWLDASGRISHEANRSEWKFVYKKAQVTDGIVMFLPTGRDIFQCTDRAMYRLVCKESSNYASPVILYASIQTHVRLQINFHVSVR